MTSLVIVVALEQAPLVVLDAEHEDEERRRLDWLEARGGAVVDARLVRPADVDEVLDAIARRQ